MSTTLVQVLTVVGLWFGYGLIHSILASTRAKDWVRAHTRWGSNRYRAIYNLVAAVSLVPVLLISSRLGGVQLWQWPGRWPRLPNVAAGLVIVGFIYSLRSYDMLAFLGLRNPQGNQPLVTDGLHRWVRHPWYSLALIFLWTRDMNTSSLTEAIMLTLYIVGGSRLEERRLANEFGEAYQRYCLTVPALIPRPWRYLQSLPRQIL